MRNKITNEEILINFNYSDIYKELKFCLECKSGEHKGLTLADNYGDLDYPDEEWIKDLKNEIRKRKIIKINEERDDY